MKEIWDVGTAIANPYVCDSWQAPQPNLAGSLTKLMQLLLVVVVVAVVVIVIVVIVIVVGNQA